MAKKTETNKPIIEALINTAALALTTFAVAEILKGHYYGFLVLGVAIGIEFVKYIGRRRLW